jgi:hypothetical protein
MERLARGDQIHARIVQGRRLRTAVDASKARFVFEDRFGYDAHGCVWLDSQNDVSVRKQDLAEFACA